MPLCFGDDCVAAGSATDFTSVLNFEANVPGARVAEFFREFFSAVMVLLSDGIGCFVVAEDEDDTDDVVNVLADGCFFDVLSGRLALPLLVLVRDWVDDVNTFLVDCGPRVDEIATDIGVLLDAVGAMLAVTVAPVDLPLVAALNVLAAVLVDV